MTKYIEEFTSDVSTVVYLPYGMGNFTKEAATVHNSLTRFGHMVAKVAIAAKVKDDVVEGEVVLRFHYPSWRDDRRIVYHLDHTYIGRVNTNKGRMGHKQEAQARAYQTGATDNLFAALVQAGWTAEEVAGRTAWVAPQNIVDEVTDLFTAIKEGSA